MGSMIFEDFGASPPAKAETVAPEPDIQSTRAIFDEGYEQGWNDAVASSEAEHRKAQTDIAVALQETSFSYVEARMHVLKSMRPLLNAVVSVILPDLAKASLSQRIADELFKLTETLEQPLKISCSPEDLGEIEKIVNSNASFPVRVAAEPTLAENQVVMKFENGDAEMDLQKTFDSITELLNDFYSSLDTEEAGHVRAG
ncbi:MAG: hypothetical protein AAGA12_10665 [Pseudomonadota bacterium]